MRKLSKLRKFMACTLVGIMAISMATTPASAKKKKAATVDLDGTYHAALGVQTSDTLWIQNLRYYDKDSNELYGTDNELKLCSKDGQTLVPHDGTYTDAEIAGNGTYTVKLEGANFDNEKAISQLHIATDIPLNDTIKFSNVTANVDGREIVTLDDGFMEDEDPYLQGGMVCLVINHWRPELVTTLKDNGLSEDSDNGYNLLTGTGDESIEITFTVSGFNYDNEAATGDTSSDAATDTSSQVSSSTDSTSNTDSSTPIIPIVIVVAVVVIAGAVIVIKKKK